MFSLQFLEELLLGGDLEPPLCLEVLGLSDEVNVKQRMSSSAMNGTTVDGVLKDFLQSTSTRLPFTSPIEKRLLGWKKGEFKNEQDEVKPHGSFILFCILLYQSQFFWPNCSPPQ